MKLFLRDAQRILHFARAFLHHLRHHTRARQFHFTQRMRAQHAVVELFNLHRPTGTGLRAGLRRVYPARSVGHVNAAQAAIEANNAVARCTLMQRPRFMRERLRIEHRSYGDLVAETIEKLTRAARIVWTRVAAWFRRIPAARKNVRHCGHAHGPARIVPFIDAVANGGAQVLVAGDVEGETAAQRATLRCGRTAASRSSRDRRWESRCARGRRRARWAAPE